MTLLDGKTAIVTGANRGIGRAIAETFRAHGATVLACVRDPMADGFQDWAVAGGYVPIRLDLADADSIKAAVKDIRAQAQAVDILVNNAGLAHGGLFQMTSMADLRAVFEVNFFGPVALTQALSRLMARKKAGSIVNIASTAALIADPGTMGYGSSKAALIRATQSMATELGASGIRVNAIAPGVTNTGMAAQMDEKAVRKLVEASALKRMAEPSDIADVALFLASDLSRHVTGQVIRADGGIV